MLCRKMAAIFLACLGFLCCLDIERIKKNDSAYAEEASTGGQNHGVIACWGDSLTAGAGARPHRAYPDVLGSLLGRYVFNGGVGGETSTQIKARMLARAPGLDQGLTIIWAGRNNFTDAKIVKSDIAAMVASLPKSARFLVLGMINGNFPGESIGEENYLRLMVLNHDLAAAYKDHFVPVHELLVAHGSGGAEDKIDAMRDLTPASLRSDDIHLNDKGYAFLAILLKDDIVEKQL